MPTLPSPPGAAKTSAPPPPPDGPALGFYSRARVMLAHGAAAMVLLDREGTILELNAAAQALLAGADAPPPRTLLDVVEPADAEPLRAALDRALAAPGAVLPTELRGRRGGHPFAFDAIHSGVAELGLVVGTYREAPSRAGLELPPDEAPRTDGIVQLAATIAHDSNNLNAAILALAELALEALPPPHAARELVQQIKQAAELAAALNWRLFEASRDARPPR